MPAKRYRKKPVEIEAIQYDGQNAEHVKSWALVRVAARSDLKMKGFDPVEIPAVKMVGNPIYIHTMEGRMRAEPGCYIICGVEGEFYPCQADIFRKTYEAVDGEA